MLISTALRLKFVVFPYTVTGQGNGLCNTARHAQESNTTLHVHIPYPARWKMYGVCRLQKIPESEVADGVRGLTVKQLD